ncbi:MAG: putative lipid II flippase FtsW [Dokdonella sp.]
MLFVNMPGAAQARRHVDVQGHYDTGLIIAAVALACLGIVMVGSSSVAVASGQKIGEFYYLKRHLVFVALGLGFAVAVAKKLELQWLQRNASWLLLLGAALLLLVFIPGVGARINGARRWLHFGPFGFQPVEAVKLLLIAYMAGYLVRQKDNLQLRVSGVLKPLGVAGIFVVLLLAQPDFGSSTLILAVTLGMVWLGGGRLRNLMLLAFPTLPILAWVALFEEYRIRRLTSFLNPWADPYNDGFQLTQALIAVGRGEWFGVGLGGSVQKLFYLPMAHTDFIMAVIAEELGLAGVITVLALYGWLAARGFIIGARGVNIGHKFAGFVAFGITLMISLQALVSIGVNLGVLPTKGLTLPLISSGGSSVMMTCVAIGLLARCSYEISLAEALAAATPPAAATMMTTPVELVRR